MLWKKELFLKYGIYGNIMNLLLLFINELITVSTFSVLISNMGNSEKYHQHEQKAFWCSQ